MLIVLSGLPGTGKTTIARLLARSLPAVHLRIDTVEQALLAGESREPGSEGYVVAYRVAVDNLRVGLNVVADAVNAHEVQRGAWVAVARECNERHVLVHLWCSNRDAHRRRVSERRADIAGHVLPAWETVAAQALASGAGAALSIDTYRHSPEDAAARIAQLVK